MTSKRLTLITNMSQILLPSVYGVWRMVGGVTWWVTHNLPTGNIHKHRFNFKSIQMPCVLALQYHHRHSLLPSLSFHYNNSNTAICQTMPASAPTTTAKNVKSKSSFLPCASFVGVVSAVAVRRCIFSSESSSLRAGFVSAQHHSLFVYVPPPLPPPTTPWMLCVCVCVCLPACSLLAEV